MRDRIRSSRAAWTKRLDATYKQCWAGGKAHFLPSRQIDQVENYDEISTCFTIQLTAPNIGVPSINLQAGDATINWERDDAS